MKKDSARRRLRCCWPRPPLPRMIAPTMAPSPTADETDAPRPQRAVGIPTALAVEAALAANAYCAAMPKKYLQDHAWSPTPPACRS